MSDIASDVDQTIVFLPVAALGTELSERTAVELVAVIRAWIMQLQQPSIARTEFHSHLTIRHHRQPTFHGNNPHRRPHPGASAQLPMFGSNTARESRLQCR